jgi:hypothetical protein
MRLMTAATLNLEDFYGWTPDYTILSHTRGTDEVTLRYMPNPHDQFSHVRNTSRSRQLAQRLWIIVFPTVELTRARLTRAVAQNYPTR